MTITYKMLNGVTGPGKMKMRGESGVGYGQEEKKEEEDDEKE